jgi:hypothetical protein
MSSSSNMGDKSPTPDRSAVVLLLADIADTTWRMFTPTLALAALGLWADETYKSGPWLSLAGVLTGCLIAALLVRLQFKRIKRNDR